MNANMTSLGIMGYLSLSAAMAETPPHIILIMTDQHRGDALGCMGNPVISPNLDQLASEGTLYTKGYSSCPSSTPARACLLTGQSPWHTGLLGYGNVPVNCQYEMPQMLRNLGYYTFGIGKMHWHPQRIKHGFHEVLLDESGRIEDENFESDYRKWFQLNCPGGNPDTTGIGWNDHQAGIYKLKEELHPTRWTSEMACQLIQHYDNASPLFLKVSFARPHSPYDPPRRFYEMYEKVNIPGPAKGEWCSRYEQLSNPEQVATDAPYGNFGDEYAKNSKRHYYASITFIDEEIGKIIQALKDKGMYDNSLIVFVSDHGDMMGDHYHWRKTYPYEGSVHIPYIVKWPAALHIAPGKVEQPVELRDVLPTFLEIAGGEVPAQMDGKSVLQLAKGDTRGWREFLDLEHATCYSDDNYWMALTDGKLKYIWNFNNGSEMLFDLEKDPQELKNLVDNKKYSSRIKVMRQALVAHLQERGEEFVKDGKPVIRQKTMLYGPNYNKK